MKALQRPATLCLSQNNFMRNTEITGTLYGHTITAHTLAVLKMKSSKIANGYCNALDQMEVVIGDTHFVFYRFNTKCPNGTIRYGQWR